MAIGVGDYVRTCVALDADAAGASAELRLDVGTRAQVHKLPAANDGYFEIAVVSTQLALPPLPTLPYPSAQM